jgi:hypothetical protein
VWLCSTPSSIVELRRSRRRNNAVSPLDTCRTAVVNVSWPLAWNRFQPPKSKLHYRIENEYIVDIVVQFLATLAQGVRCRRRRLIICECSSSLEPCPWTLAPFSIATIWYRANWANPESFTLRNHGSRHDGGAAIRVFIRFGRVSNHRVILNMVPAVPEFPPPPVVSP